MTQGLEAAINTYAQNALALANEPTSALSINNTYLLFLALTSPYDVLEGIDTLAQYSIGRTEAVYTRLMTIEVRWPSAVIAVVPHSPALRCLLMTTTKSLCLSIASD